ncbi:MAG: amidohydrolase family protein [Dehalococcoidia bacterium]
MKVVTGATLIDGTGGPVLPNASVVIDGERIVDVGPGGHVSYPDDTEVVSISGMTLLPGLIDCHDHLASPGVLGPLEPGQVGVGYGLERSWQLDAPFSIRVLDTAKTLKDTLDMGYTAVRDGGGLDAGFKQAIEEGLIPGPRLVVSVSIISPTGGLADHVAPSGHCQSSPVNPNLGIGIADGPDAVRAKVREMIRRGADVIKFATTGGASSRPGHGPRDQEYTLEEARVLVKEAHLHGRKAMCHAIGGPGLRVALEAGADTIEHGAYLDEDPGYVMMMSEGGAFFVPTFTVYVYHSATPTPHIRPRAQALWPHLQESVGKALAAGVKVVAGTDAGGYVHGDNAQELQCMVEAGMSTMQAIQAATGWAAECIGLEKDIGTVEKGKLADLVVVDGDPLTDIRVLRQKERINMVFKGGQVQLDRRGKTGAKVAS